jgi:hypothetical protein
MGRYDLAINKKGKDKKFVSVPDTIAEDIRDQTFDNPNDVTSAQTAIRGKNLMIRGPNGYQVSIPLRFVSIENAENGYELRLQLTPDIARGLSRDLVTVQNDPNERFRSSDLGEQRRRPSSFLRPGVEDNGSL